MDYEVQIEHVAARPLASSRVQAPRDQLGPVMGREMQRVVGLVCGLGVVCVGAPVVLYHRFDEELVDMDVAVPVGRAFQDVEGVRSTALPEGEAAIITHVGPYEGIGAAWEALGAWVREHGHAYEAPCWEEYLTDPAAEPDPAKWVTRLFWMIG